MKRASPMSCHRVLKRLKENMGGIFKKIWSSLKGDFVWPHQPHIPDSRGYSMDDWPSTPLNIVFRMPHFFFHSSSFKFRIVYKYTAFVFIFRFQQPAPQAGRINNYARQQILHIGLAGLANRLARKPVRTATKLLIKYQNDRPKERLASWLL